MDRFRVGQMVTVAHDDVLPELRGVVCTIAQTRRWMITNTGRDFVYELDLEIPKSLLARFPETRMIVACEEDLKPVYDGDCASSWDDCAWRPSVVRA